MFFESWDGVYRVLIMGTFAYLALVAILRVSGKRTLAKMNAFDLVVTVALGSTLATILLSRDVAFIEGVAALLTLVALQYSIAKLSVHWHWVEQLAKSDPQALLVDGVFDCEALRRERVTPEEVLCAIRSAGFGDTSDVATVILENDGSFSVISHSRAGARSAIPNRSRGRT
jgi:uncharacterized membrane protein YcaP (DUF421 family)